MRMIKQRNETDCGIACLAMLASISWAQAKHALFGKRRRKGFYTTKDEMRAALIRFGVITSKRLVVCRNPERLERDAPLRTNVLANGNWHWAVWDAKRKKVLDPYYKRTRFCSCLVVRRRTDPISD
jgi:ABC-type bacteriocin/lantibiotic exporter with double-glycine peptidase domain